MGPGWRRCRSRTFASGLAQRARVVLLASNGVANYVIVGRVGVSRRVEPFREFPDPRPAESPLS